MPIAEQCHLIVAQINRVFGLNDEDSEEFRALFREPDNEKILQELTDGKSPWSRKTKQEIKSFPIG